MSAPTRADPDIRQAVPFFWVRDLDRSIRFYTEGLGFRVTNRWIDGGKIRWCWLERGTAALMLQEFWADGPHKNLPEGPTGVGVSICFICGDAIALWRELTARGTPARRPVVENRMWVTGVTDPDGYRLVFESPTDAPEELEYEDGPTG
jgi:catechol 2,3-dioxygenase-like lactoylglutathione lyase family enzyme